MFLSPHCLFIQGETVQLYCSNNLRITNIAFSFVSQAFAEAASKTSDVFKKDQAPFDIKNSLGLPISVTYSDSFTPLNVDPGLKSVELKDGDSLNLDYVRAKSQTDQFSAMTSLSSKHFYIRLGKLNSAIIWVLGRIYI